MAHCRFCQKPCEHNRLLLDRFFREKLQDVLCMWVDVNSETDLVHVCHECELYILEFYTYKQQCREILRKPAGTKVRENGENELFAQYCVEDRRKLVCAPDPENCEVETVNNLSVNDPNGLELSLSNNEETMDYSVEVFEDFESDSMPFAENQKSEIVIPKRTRKPCSLTEEQRLAKQIRPKRILRRKTEEEKAMPPDEYKKYYYKMISERYKQTCEICGKRLPPERMEGHTNGHKGLQPFACEFCELQFNCKINMRKHVQRSHAIGVEVPCGMCDKIMASRAALRQHVRTVHEEKKYRCSVCGLKCPNKNSMNRHMNIHTQTRNFVCPHCPKAFYCNSVLKIHLRTHSGETPYKCTICPKGFVHRRLYVLHMKKFHPGEPLMRIDSTKELKTTLMKKHY